MPKRFAATEYAVEKGLSTVTPKQGAKLAGDWLTELENVDTSGAKGIHGDLQRLVKELEKDEPNGDRVQKILGKLGPATVKIADKIEDETLADKVRELGQALVDHGVEGDDADEDED